MFNQLKYYDYKNDVPKSFARNAEGCSAFNVSIPVQENWDKAKRKILFVTGHVISQDLKNKRLLSKDSKDLLNNCIGHSQSILEPYTKIKDFAYAAINFNFFRNYHLKGDLLNQADEIQTQRVKDFIKKFKPTHVIICGAKPSSLILKDIIDLPMNKMGWVHNKKINGHKCLVTSTVDFSLALEDGKKEQTNLEESENEDVLVGAYQLGFFCRNLASLFNGSIPWAKKIRPVKPVLVDSIKKFKSMMKVLYSHDAIAVDTETANLNKIANSLLICQFSVSSKEGYVLPFHHKDSPYNTKELKYIREELRKFFMQKKTGIKQYLVFFNAKFDVTQLRQALGIPFIYWPIYDCMAGEHALDDTTSLLHKVVSYNKKKVKFGNLAQMLCTYGDDFYYNHTFAKADRANIVSENLSKSILEYCAYDTQSILFMHDSQINRANNTYHQEHGKSISFGKSNAFLKLVLFQYSNNIHGYAEMEHCGSYCDVKYLLSLQSENSDLSKQIRENERAIYNTKYAQKANDKLLKEKGVDKKKTIFKAPFVFKLNDNKHKELLFFDVLKLKPVNFSKKSGKPSLGKLFKEFHKENSVVKLFNNLEKAKKIKSTYVTAFIKALSKADGKDGYLRAMFGFFEVLTGRANSSKPSFQQVPEHGALAKIIKRIFIAPKGHLIIKLDYSAHEVRCWAIMSFDDVLAKTFQVGRDFRKKLYETGKYKYIKEIYHKGDVHKLNAAFFFKVAIETVDKILRQATKAIVFGAIYGKSIKSMARDLKREIDFVKKLYKDFFTKFSKAAKWLEWAVKFSEKNLFVYSPNGRRRYLIGYLVPNEGVHAAMRRRAQNAPVQGFGSDLVHTASRLVMQHIYEYLLKIEEVDFNTEHLPIRIHRMVHDSIFSSSPFHLVIAAVHIIQWCCVKGVSDFYDENFGIKFNVPLEIEVEIGASSDATYKWDWNVQKFDEDKYDATFKDAMGDEYYKKEKDPETGKDRYKMITCPKTGKQIKVKYELEAFPLEHCIKLSCIDYCKIHGESEGTPKELYKKVMSSWHDSKVKKYLDKHYPILP